MIKQNIIKIGVILLSLMSFKSQVVDAATNKSKTETINYRTTYQDKEYKKQATVYVPAKYDNKKKHNIIYLMHGSTESGRDFYQDGNFKKILDKLNRVDKLKNTIVVFPTYYPNRSFVNSDYYRDRPLNKNFAKKELTKDLMPAVEKKYHTYAKTTDNEGFKESRRHRAFGGFSMGSITTWYVFENNLKYFHDFLPMAGDSWTIKPDGGAVASKRTASRLAESTDSRSFQILAAVGANDGTSGSMTPQIEAMWRLPEFNHQNLKYYTQKGGSHSPQSIGKQFEHYAGELFKK